MSSVLTQTVMEDIFGKMQHESTGRRIYCPFKITKKTLEKHFVGLGLQKTPHFLRALSDEYLDICKSTHDNPVQKNYAKFEGHYVVLKESGVFIGSAKTFISL
jgi:hypothetical protein